MNCLGGVVEAYRCNIGNVSRLFSEDTELQSNCSQLQPNRTQPFPRSGVRHRLSSSETLCGKVV